MLGFGPASDDFGSGSDALRGAVTDFGFRLVAVELDEHRVVDVAPEGVVYGVQIRLVAVGRELHAGSESAGQIVNECPRCEEAWQRVKDLPVSTKLYCCASGAFLGGPFQRGDEMAVHVIQPRCRTGLPGGREVGHRAGAGAPRRRDRSGWRDII